MQTVSIENWASEWIHKKSGLINEVKKSVVDYKSELSALRKKL